MVAILENPEIRQLVGKISVEQYEEFDDSGDGKSTELIRGIIIERTPPPSPFHSFLITRLHRWVLAALGTLFIVGKSSRSS